MDNLTLLFKPLRRVMAAYNEFLVPLFLVILYMTISDYQQQNRLQLIHQPKIHDFYFVDYYSIDPNSDARFRYLPLKITSINPELITFKIGNVGHSQPAAITDHVKFDAAMTRNYFRTNDLSVSHQKVFEWLESGIVYDIARPTNIYVNGWIVMRLSELQHEKG